ncbi:MAG: hypothetical protein M0P21_11815 [Methanoculleus sp.]|uniref:Uncharacterized protein n=2 Tax=Methanoculleus bourgensis TaxID=83986 RepID=A0A0X3BPS1_9EURY|nr:hypothetical protein [Methanoculleus sp.]CVK33929.1 protein of unknown function [Methanoculleus bourgensis]
MVMVTHREILHAARLLVEITGNNEFTPEEIIVVLKCAGSSHPETDIRTEMRRCSVDSPKHHYTTYDYFEDIGRGRYRLIEKGL